VYTAAFVPDEASRSQASAREEGAWKIIHRHGDSLMAVEIDPEGDAEPWRQGRFGIPAIRLQIERSPVVTQPSPAPSLSSPREAPSIHVHAALTWLAIFPMVAVGLTAMAPFTVGWTPVLRAFALTVVVVPLAVYVVVPRLLSIYGRHLATRR
jgi:hypothetical protein